MAPRAAALGCIGATCPPAARLRGGAAAPRAPRRRIKQPFVLPAKRFIFKNSLGAAAAARRRIRRFGGESDKSLALLVTPLIRGCAFARHMLAFAEHVLVRCSHFSPAGSCRGDMPRPGDTELNWGTNWGATKPMRVRAGRSESTAGGEANRF